MVVLLPVHTNPNGGPEFAYTTNLSPETDNDSPKVPKGSAMRLTTLHS